MTRPVQMFAILVVIVLLSGCGGLVGSGDDADRDPYGVDAPTPVESENSLPSITEETVTDRYQVRQAYVDFLANYSYTLEHTRTETHPNGTIAQEYAFNATAEADGHAIADTTNMNVWANETTIFTRIGGAVDENSTYGPQYYSQQRTKYHFTEHRVLEQGLMEMENITVTATTDDGVTRYILESNETPQYGYENGSLRLVITEHGYLESYRFEYEKIDGTTVTTEMSVVLVDDPALPDDPPAWVESAKESLEHRTTPSRIDIDDEPVDHAPVDARE
ncbi:hypothetical protein OB919_04365 [Halobacteria archaeon AArc-curdl1]|uniref:Uncharacterized protein n=2 Tax=Natronosalvus hydrolyticus TaxID=2979988 RepID=A0AAP2Z5Y8_9EURY|nr:hypothetical protein [Halobacteria archaeon AArc-curdl1]